MSTKWRYEAIQILVILGMFAASAAVWTYVPDRMPVHWNLAGEPDRFGGKFEGLFLTPLIAVGLYAMFLVLPLIDPRRASYAAFARGYAIIRVAALGLVAVIHAILLLVALGYHLNIGMLVPLAVGIMLCIIGNFMGKIRPNWFVGVRTPWTLSSRASWNKSNRLGGRLFIAMGFALFLLAFVPNVWTLTLLLGMVAIVAIWLPVYSYLVWRHDPDRGGAGDSGT
jgi:uncharacterized membrane protein